MRSKPKPKRLSSKQQPLRSKRFRNPQCRHRLPWTRRPRQFIQGHAANEPEQGQKHMETELQLAVGYIETFAGNGKAGSTGDGKRAVKSGIPLPHHAALDKTETWFYFAESGSDRIRRINLSEGTHHHFALI